MTVCVCGASWTGLGICHCPTQGCHLTFTSIRSFDEHRTGPTDTRRCMTIDELRVRGMEPNNNGQWRHPRPEDTQPAEWTEKK